MQRLLNKFKYAAIILATFLMIGCGGKSSGSIDDGNVTVAPASTTPTTTTTTDDDDDDDDEQVENTTVSGNVVDGPIYGATVRIYKSSDTTFSNPIATTTTSSATGKVGFYTLSVASLPATYIVRITGGTDAGDDGIVDDRDEASNFELSTVGEKTKSTNSHVSPATSLVVENMKQGQSVSAAKETIRKAFGLDEGVELTQLDPKTDTTANKLGKAVANIVKMMPTDNLTDALGATAEEFKSQVDNNKTVANTDDTGDVTFTDDLNMTAIADGISDVTETEKAIIEKIADNLVQIIESEVQASKPVEDINATNKNEAYAREAGIKAAQKLIKEAENADAIDGTKIVNVVDATKEAIETILDTNDSVLDKDNIEDILEVVEKNADKNMSALGNNLVEIAKTTQDLADETNAEVKKLAEEMIGNIDLNNTNGVNAVTNMLEDTEALEQQLDGKSDTVLETLAETLVTQANTEGNVTISDLNDTVTELDALSATMGTIAGYVGDENETISMVGSWLQQAVALNMEQDINISSSITNLYYDIMANHIAAADTVVKVAALKGAVITVDLNGTEAVNGTLKGNLETAFGNLQSGTYDFLSSIECAEIEVIKADKANTLGGPINLSVCINEQPLPETPVVVDEQVFKAMELLGIEIPNPDIDVDLQYKANNPI